MSPLTKKYILMMNQPKKINAESLISSNLGYPRMPGLTGINKTSLKTKTATFTSLSLIQPFHANTLPTILHNLSGYL